MGLSSSTAASVNVNAKSDTTATVDTSDIASLSNDEIVKEKLTTWNGAATYDTVTNPLVEIFFKSVRNLPCTDYQAVPLKPTKKEKEKAAAKDLNAVFDDMYKPAESPKPLEDYFDAAWQEYPLLTLKFVFYLRDCRQGKGEKKLFRAIIRHMREKGLTPHILTNLALIPYYGSWKDVNMCCFGTSLEPAAIKLIADQLQQDITSETPSLCAKYAPSESSALDTKHHAVKKIINVLNVNQQRYRKQYLAPLRAKLNIVERDMCAQHWETINYEHVTSLAGSKYKKAFTKHDATRYAEYLKSVQKGEKKMNVSVLMPHQIVESYLLDHAKVIPDETIEAQWVSFIKDRKAKIPANFNILPMVDVSGSMTSGGPPAPINVSVSLGLLFATLNQSPALHKRMLTFSSDPELVTITGETLLDNVHSMVKSKWGMTTNILTAFDLLLETAKIAEMPPAEMPKIVLILSDMQFDMANGNPAQNELGIEKTNWQAIDEKYLAAGYERPIIIFWNLNGTSLDFPVPSANTPKCILISGYNDVILYSILDLEYPNPFEIVSRILNSERYSDVKLDGSN